MQPRRLPLLLRSLATLAAAAPFAAAQVYVQDEALVIFPPGTTFAQIDARLDLLDASLMRRIDGTEVYVVGCPAGVDPQVFIAQLEAQGPVSAASPNYYLTLDDHLVLPDDPDFPLQWGLDNRGRIDNDVPPGLCPNQTLSTPGVIDADIDAPQAWAQTTDCTGQVIAVIDTGIALGNADFAGNLWVNPIEVADGYDNDANGVIDDINGANFLPAERYTNGGNVAANGRFDATDAVYLDVDGNRFVSAADVLLHGNPTPGAFLREFSQAGKRWELHTDQVDADGLYDPGESIYWDKNKDFLVDPGDQLLGGPSVADGTPLITFAMRPNGGIEDEFGHGTGVASIIGARGNNGIGIAGVCWRAELMTLRVMRDLNSGISTDAALAAYGYVLRAKLAGVNIHVVNESASGTRRSEVDLQTLELLEDAEIMLVCTAGNESRDVDGVGPLTYPCGFALDNVICVGASDSTDDLACFSNWGITSVDLLAPGQNVRVLTMTDGVQEFTNGTSFAAPHVTGAAAHCWSLFPTASVAEVRARLLSGTGLPAGSTHPHGVDLRYGAQTHVASGSLDGRLRMVCGDDMGDAPPIYPTLLADNGARHEDCGEEWLGKAANVFMVDASGASPEFDAAAATGLPPDPDGSPNLVDSDAEDDGVELFGPFLFSPPGGPPVIARVDVYIDTENYFDESTGAPFADGDGGRYGSPVHFDCGVHDPADDAHIWVNAFFDWNQDGDWDDTAEHPFLLRADPSAGWTGSGGYFRIEFPMPEGPPFLGPVCPFARFRLDYGENCGQALDAPPHALGAPSSPGGLVKFWNDPGGLPTAPGAAVAQRWESVTTFPPGLDLTYGVAQYGEVEDYHLPLGGAAPYHESFDTYANGASINGLGGWRQWNGAAITDAFVTNARAHSPPHSLYTERRADKVREFTTFTQGYWEIHAWTYVPSTMVDPQWGVLLSDYYDNCGSNCSWVAQFQLDAQLAEFRADLGHSLCTGASQWSVTAPLVVDAWAEVVCVVDLCSDVAQLHYNGLPVGDPFAWSNALGSGPGPLALDAIDLYANDNPTAGDRMYWDDISIVPGSGPVPACQPLVSNPASCPLGTSSDGCAPSIQGIGTPSASAASGFTIQVAGASNNKTGLVFYGITDLNAQAAAWGTTSYLCVKAPTQRMPAANSSNVNGVPCTGSHAVDWNAFMAAHTGALGSPRFAGQSFDAQYWFRDPPAVKATNLSRSLRFSLAP